MAAITRDEIAELARLGCTYIQLDAPHYPLLIDPDTRAFYESHGWTAERWLDRGIELDNAVIDGHPDVTFGFHLCRGNQGSRWLVSGGYEPIARQVFRGRARRPAAARVRRRALRHRSSRSRGARRQDGRARPGHDQVAPGWRRRELEARIREAARHVDLERLAISPQCGFATSVIGNAITPDAQRAKLELLARVAGRVWG